MKLALLNVKDRDLFLKASLQTSHKIKEKKNRFFMYQESGKPSPPGVSPNFIDEMKCHTDILLKQNKLDPAINVINSFSVERNLPHPHFG